MSSLIPSPHAGSSGSHGHADKVAHHGDKGARHRESSSNATAGCGRARPDNGGAIGGVCLDWDLAAVSVPPEVAFRFPRKPGWVSFDGDPADALAFWDRVDAGNARLATSDASGGQGEPRRSLHAALCLGTGRATAALAEALRGVRQGIKAARGTSDGGGAASGGGGVSSGPGGVFVLLRGDSHLRILLSMLIVSLSGDPEVLDKAK
jgi:hypothetical protein